jgi:hypothetical protein
MMGNPPFSVNDFFIEVRRLEDIVDSLAGSTEKEDVKKTANDSLVFISSCGGIDQQSGDLDSCSGQTCFARP